MSSKTVKFCEWNRPQLSWVLPNLALFKDPPLVIFRRKRIEECREPRHSDDRRYIRTYLKLEERRVLNATFAFDLVASELTLENFVDSGTGNDSVDISQLGDDYVFSLNDGIWNIGGPIAGLDFALSGGDSILTIADGSDSLSTIVFNDNSDATFDLFFDQFNFSSGRLFVNNGIGSFGSLSQLSSTSVVSIGEFEFSAESIDFSNDGNDFDVVNGIASNNISIHDQDELGTQFLVSNSGTVSLQAAGTISIDDGGSPIGLLSANEINIVTTDSDSDIIVNNTIAVDTGDIMISAADKIQLLHATDIVSTGPGSITLLSNQVGGNDDGEFQMMGSSIVDANDGEILISTQSGSGEGDVHITTLMSNSQSESAIRIDSAGQIQDGSLAENANLVAPQGGVQLVAAEQIGGLGIADLNTNVQTIAFDTQDGIQLVDIGQSLTIGSLGSLAHSAAQGGGLISAFSLTINSNITLGDSTTFSTISSVVPNNDIVIDNNAVVMLDSTASSELRFDAADDLIFDGGSVITSGNDAQHVVLMADREMVADGDVGSVTNSAMGPSTTVTTNLLTIVAGDGIGDSSGIDTHSNQAFRIDADSIFAENFAANGILIMESNNISLTEILNIGRDIQLQANGDISDGDGLPDNIDVDGGHVILSSSSGSIGNGDVDVFKLIVQAIEINATESLDVSAINGLVAVDLVGPFVPSTYNALSLVISATGDLDIYELTSAAILNVTNLGLIADSDNDGSGTLTLFQSISVAGDLRIEGHDIVALDAFQNITTADLAAHRLLLSTDNSSQFTTQIDQLDIEFDSAVEPGAQTDDQFLLVENTRAIDLIDLNCDANSILSSNDDIKIVAPGSIAILDGVAVGSSTLFFQADGDLTQSQDAIIAAHRLGVAIGGQTVLAANNQLDVFAANNIGSSVLNNLGDLSVGAVTFAAGSNIEMNVTGVTTNHSDVKLMTSGDLTIDWMIDLNGGNLLFDAGGNLAQGDAGTIDVSGLGLMFGGTSILNADNDVDVIAADGLGPIQFNDVDDIQVGFVDVSLEPPFGMALLGITTIDGDLKLSGRDILIAESITVGFANVFLNIAGDVNQLSSGTIQANGLGLMVSGQTVLDSENDVNAIAAANDGAVLFTDVDDLVVDTVTIAAGGVFEMSVSGITSLDNDIKLNVGDSLFLQQNISVGSGGVLLSADGDVGQSTTGIIGAEQLGLKVNGTTILNAANDVNIVAMVNSGQTIFSNANDLTVGFVEVFGSTVHEMSLSGIATSNHDVKLNLPSLFIDQAITSGSGTVFIAATGNVAQSFTGTIQAKALGLMADGIITLDANNDVDVFAVENSGQTIFNDSDDLLVGSVTVLKATSFEMNVDGIAIENNDLKLETGDLTIDESIRLENGNLFISSIGNVQQSETGIIVANEIGLMVAGETILAANNNTNVLAAATGGPLVFTDVNDVIIGTVMAAPGTPFEMTAVGIVSENADVKLSLAGDALIQAAIMVGDATLFIDAAGSLLQSATGTITADQIGLMIDGDAQLDALNDANVLAAKASGYLIFNDIDNLVISTVSVAAGTEFEMLVSGIRTDASELLITVGGDLLIENTIDVGNSGFFVESGGSVTQSPGASIIASTLGLAANEDVVLKSNNDIGIFAAVNNGKLFFNNIGNLEIGVATIFTDSEFSNSLTGIHNSGDTKLTATGSIVISERIDNGSATTFLMSTGSISQNEDGIILSGSLGLNSTGAITLAAANDVDQFAAASDNAIIFNDTDNLTVSQVTIFADTEHEMSADGIVTNDSDAKILTGDFLQLNSMIDIGASSLILAVEADLQQAHGGTINAAGLGIIVTGQTILDLANSIESLAIANQDLTVFNNIGELAIESVSVFADSAFAMSVDGITSVDDVKIINTGNLHFVGQVSIGDGGLFVTSDGNLSQTSTGTIHADQFGIMIDGLTRLDANNNVDIFAANNNGQTIFNDVDDLQIGSVTIAQNTSFSMQAIGISTNDADIKLSTSGNLNIDDSIDIGDGSALLVVAGNLAQNSGDPDGLDGTVIAQELGVMVDGVTDLSNPSNAFAVFAAQANGNILISNSQNLTLGTVMVDAMSIVGLKTQSNLNLFVDGHLDQSAAIQVQNDALISTTGNVCLTGGDCDGDGLNDNDFMGVVSIVAGSHVEIVDVNNLAIDNILAGDQIWLQAGSTEPGQLYLNGFLTTDNLGGQILLQASNGIQQHAASVIDADNLMLGSSSESNARSGDYVLNGDNVVTNLAANIDGRLEFTNRRDLHILPLAFSSRCLDFEVILSGIDVVSIEFNVTSGDATLGSLTDSDEATSMIQSTADFNVAANIILGDGDAILQFTDHSIDNLLHQNHSDEFVRISAIGNGAADDGTDLSNTQNVTLFVDSTIILSETNVANTLFIDTIEATPANGSAGDILQSTLDDDSASTITAKEAAFVSRASVQLTNSNFERLAVDANQGSSQTIYSFQLNENITSTFTGSIDADVFTGGELEPFQFNGNFVDPVTGVSNVESSFLADGFFAGNNQFFNLNRAGAIVFNVKNIELVAFNDLNLDSLQLADVTTTSAAITTQGDTYVETKDGHDIKISANVDVTEMNSNITVVAGNDVSLSNNAELRRLDNFSLVGLVNTIQGLFLNDPFTLQDPRSVLTVPGDAAFADLNAQLDTAVGYQQFDLFFGNLGERSFNIIAGWFVEGVSPSEAIDATFQQTLLQEMNQLTMDFLLSDISNFGQSISAYAIRSDSFVEGQGPPLTLSNISMFDQGFFANESFLLSQIFVTNDARINLFADNGATDLNFSQELIPTRTVVQNPDIIVVARPEIEIPTTLGAAPDRIFNFVNLVQEPESRPLTTSQQPEAFFQVRFTADDDGIYEESFKWTDPNDDPDAIRAAIERAVLNNDNWPQTEDGQDGNWTDRIKKEKQVKPGLYYIFEVQEGELIPDPVDAPIDRTDIENLVDPAALEPVLHALGWEASGMEDSDMKPVEAFESITTANETLAPTTSNRFDRSQFSAATQSVLLGSTLLMGQCLIDQNNRSKEENIPTQELSRQNMFSRSSRFRRLHQETKQHPTQ